MGIFDATFPAIFWPCTPLVVDKKIVGSAYGLITSLLNLIMFLVPLLMGVIHDHSKGMKSGYFWTEIALIGIVGFGAFVTFKMYYVDKKSGLRLERAKSKIQDKDKKRKYSEDTPFLNGIN